MTGQVKLIQEACRLIEVNPHDPPTLAALGEALDISAAHLQRLFKKVVGISPRQYADACRVGRLKKRLRDGESVTAALYEAGYGSSRSLYERTSAHLGMTPGTYRRKGKGMVIRYTLADCPLGRLLLAATERGISAVYLGDRDELLCEALAHEYAEAKIDRDDAVLRVWLEELLAHLNGEQPHLDLPIDVQATAFQWRVWQELQKIPAGTTKTYSEIARAIGSPTAARAVARGCATNPVSIVIPCHRVIREDGSLGGYRWGLGRKQALLELESERAK